EWYYLRQLCHGERLTLRGHRAPVRAVAFAADGRTLATAGWDWNRMTGTVKLWDPASGRERLALQNDKFFALALAPDGKTLATGGLDQSVRLWDAATGEELTVLGGHTRAVGTVAFSPDGKTLASASGFWRVRPANPVFRFVSPSREPGE